MKMRAGFLATCAVGALAIGMGYASPVLAADKMMPTKAPAAEPVTWWYDGFAEVGGRFHLNGPDKNTLGKFYEYRDLRPGVFGNFYIGAHRTNPIDIVAWGSNVGWNDQAFGLELAKVGEHYLTFGWDETPHFYSKNARTTYTTSGSTLSTPTYPYPPSATTQAFVDANSRTFDLKYRRDTASASYRWTPSPNWDVGIDYSHMHRHGEQPISVLSFSLPAGRGGAGTRNTIELPKPVDDTTQNGNFKGEYAGSTPWDTPFNIAFGYGFSIYNTDHNSLTYQNPWNTVNSAVYPLWNRYALFPDNKAQTFSVTAGVGLPFHSRYMGTFQYSIMTQDDTFLPSTINPLVAPATLTASSLGGDARTTLSNNVLHTQWSPTVKTTLRYRYYRYHSNQDPITITGLYANPDSNAGAEPALTAHPINYTKQNANADVVWRALNWLTVGGGYGWERWARDITYSDVSATNENTGKIFADAKFDWSMVRMSLQYGARRYTSPYVVVTANNNAGYRVKEYADRNRWKGMGSWSIDLPMNLNITPNGGFRYDDYLTNPFMGAGVSEIGLVHDNSWNAGVDLSWSANHSLAFYVSYNYESGYRQVYQNSQTPDLNMETRDRNHTVVFGSKITVIPDKLFLNTTYTYARSASEWTSECTEYGCRYTPLATFPVAHNTLQRLDATAKYLFDKDFTRNVGWMGQAYLKLRVLWEKNSSDNWQTLSEQLGWAVNSGDTTMARAVFLGTGNPNYNVVLGIVSFGVKW